MRVTSSMMSYGYTKSLNRNLSKLNSLYETCLTSRKFQKASQNPSAFLKEAHYKKEDSRIENYLNNISTIKSKFECAEGNMQEINSVLKDVSDNLLNAMTGTLNDDNRKILANQLRDMQDNILKTANFKFAGNYIFGGNENKNPPLEYDKETNTLKYLGLDVSDPANFDKLEQLSNEQLLADIGFVGADGNVTAENAMDVSLSALKLLGFGNETVDGETIDKNIIVLMGEMADMLEKDDFDSKEMQPHLDAFQKQHSNFLTSLADIGSKTKLLDNTKERLSDLQINITKSIANTSGVDYATALTEYQMQQIVYNVSMQMGANVIPNTLFNFIK